MDSSKTRINIENRSKVIAFLDTSVEINVMNKEVIEDISLAVRQGPKLELISHTVHSYPFHSLCKDVEVVIEGLKMRHPIFIVQYGNHNLVFDAPFLNSVSSAKNISLMVFLILLHTLNLSN